MFICPGVAPGRAAPNVDGVEEEEKNDMIGLEHFYGCNFRAKTVMFRSIAASSELEECTVAAKERWDSGSTASSNRVRSLEDVCARGKVT